MLFISPILNFYYKQKLKKIEYRNDIFKQALDKKLRKTKLGRIILRNMHEEMTKNPFLHEELAGIIGNPEEYQKKFWGSDLGFFWLNGNYKISNPNFKLTIDTINENKYKSHLDIGCGWGELSMLVAMESDAQRIVGIDISNDLISKAQSMHSHEKAEYLCKDVMQMEESFEIITVIGPVDYIKPDEFPSVLRKILSLAKKEIILIHSLRAQPMEEVLKIKTALEVKRYDIGYVQPLNFLLSQFKEEYSFSYEVQKHGVDALLARIIILDNKKI
jgi:2-polyprenyl-3-methyl-5-hydroxy-6-metoxy-1,4-benzoquinol methylase